MSEPRMSLGAPRISTCVSHTIWGGIALLKSGRGFFNRACSVKLEMQRISFFCATTCAQVACTWLSRGLREGCAAG